MIELIDFMMQQFLLGVILKMLFDLILTWKLIILGISSKLNLSIKESNLLIYPVYLKIILLSLIYLLILKIRNLLFVISTINIFVVLYLTINKLVT